MLHLPMDLPKIEESKKDKALVRLERELGPSKVLTERDACEPFARDDSDLTAQTPFAVVRAEQPEDIVKALAIAREAEVPITPRAAGTGRTGGALPVAGGIVLSMLGMPEVKHLDRREGVVVVSPGCVLGDVHRAVEAEGWFYPPDANSWSSCTIGGNVAENAGGPRAFKYGVTRDYVLGMDAFLMGGQRIFAGRRTKKGVTGYDVAGLLVGSEGTLAVVGDITLRLVPKPPSVMTLLALFGNLHDASRAVEAITGAGLVPRCIELMDARTLEAMRQAGNSINPQAGALLLMDVDGDEAACETQAERIAEACESVGVLELLAAQDASQRDRLWSARREMSLAVRRLAKHKIAEDIVVPRQSLTTLLEQVDELAERERIQHLTYGHAGDGNLHVNFLWDHEDEEERVTRCVEGLFRATVAMGGTLSGEHGVGVVKAPYLPLEQSEELIALQRDIKRLFDPQGLLNPHKIFPRTGHGPC